MEADLAIALIFGTPVIIAGFWTASKTVERVLASQERRMQMRLLAERGSDERLERECAALRAELNALRDTSTEFDISLESTMRGISDRLSRIEHRMHHSPSSQPGEEVRIR